MSAEPFVIEEAESTVDLGRRTARIIVSSERGDNLQELSVSSAVLHFANSKGLLGAALSKRSSPYVVGPDGQAPDPSKPLVGGRYRVDYELVGGR